MQSSAVKRGHAHGDMVSLLMSVLLMRLLKYATMDGVCGNGISSGTINVLRDGMPERNVA